jgi:AraC family transcriptional regulator, ethanolamine operon transcriptional activator
MSNPCKSNSVRNLVLSRSFTDIDELAEVVSSRRQVRLTQLQAAQFHCNLCFLEFNEAQFMFIHSQCPGRAIGEKQLNNYVAFSCILEQQGDDLAVHGHKVTNNTLFGFDTNRPIDLVVPAQLEYCTVLIQKQMFEEYLEGMNRLDLNEQFFKSHFVVCNNAFQFVRCFLIQVKHLIKTEPQFISLFYQKKILLEDFIPLLINAIPLAGKTGSALPLPLNQTRLVRQAEDYMLAHLEEALTLKDLCKALNTSSRPLFYGFQAMFGLSPMAYLKQLRLHSVHRTLKTSNPTTTNVYYVANQFGFWSAGHFARDYKELFGEHPSVTLCRTLK